MGYAFPQHHQPCKRKRNVFTVAFPPLKVLWGMVWQWEMDESPMQEKRETGDLKVSEMSLFFLACLQLCCVLLMLKGFDSPPLHNSD